jgi:translation initiation factor 1
MPGLFDGTPLERPVTCDQCGEALGVCACPRDAEGRVVHPKDQPIRVRRERRGGGKVVTIISGLTLQTADMAAMLKGFKTNFGTGGTLSDGRLELQGDHRDKLVEMLRQRGYPAKASGG